MTDSKLNLYKIIAEEAIMGILVYDVSTWECTHANKMALGTLEISDQFDITTLSLESLYPQEAKPTLISLSREIVEHEGLTQDVLMRKLNDSVFIADLGVRKIKVDDNEYLLLMFRDMTVQKKLQREIITKQQEIQNAFQELTEQNEELKALDKAKDRFVALTTHELKTPLSAMIATAEVLKIGLYDDKEQMNGFIQTIYDEGRHLLEIINDILDFSKIQAGKMDFYIEHKSPAEILTAHIEHFTSMAEEKSVSLTFHKPDIEALCYFDELRLKQVTANVINNAIKFTKKNTEVSLELKKHEDMLQITVKDHGPGIPEEYRERIFNEFETVGNVNTHHKGTGLGMPISKRLMEGMGGSITFETEIGQGTVFSINVPITKKLDESVYRARPEFAQEVA